MKVTRIRRVEGCIEGRNVRDMVLDRQVTKSFIDYLAALGRLIYMESSKRPLFKVIVRGVYTLKGSQGNKTVRVLLPEDEEAEGIMENIKEYVERYTTTKKIHQP